MKKIRLTDRKIYSERHCDDYAAENPDVNDQFPVDPFRFLILLIVVDFQHPFVSENVLFDYGILVEITAENFARHCRNFDISLATIRIVKMHSGQLDTGRI